MTFKRYRPKRNVKLYKIDKRMKKKFFSSTNPNVGIILDYKSATAKHDVALLYVL